MQKLLIILSSLFVMGSVVTYNGNGGDFETYFGDGSGNKTMVAPVPVNRCGPFDSEEDSEEEIVDIDEEIWFSCAIS